MRIQFQLNSNNGAKRSSNLSLFLNVSSSSSSVKLTRLRFIIIASSESGNPNFFRRRRLKRSSDGAMKEIVHMAEERREKMERKYDIEENSLEGLYKDWQKKLHPDLVHSKSESEKEYAAEQSSRIIDAYRTLKNSLSRAIYLMKLQGVHVDEEQTVSDPELLAEIMEIRESVEDAPDPQALKQIQAEVSTKLDSNGEDDMDINGGLGIDLNMLPDEDEDFGTDEQHHSNTQHHQNSQQGQGQPNNGRPPTHHK
uniref:Co-chaperone HscB C-terminal oligomerisation domain-containing protein n=1 Tax=Chenopodium quinoa TaxID=63459 RepID=A0A803MJW2_CHEQI